MTDAPLYLLIAPSVAYGHALAAPRYTIADLARFPDDGNRYELLGGVLLVIPVRYLDSSTWRLMGDCWLAVEVSEPGLRVYDRDFKTAAYLQAGVREVWRADLRVADPTPARGCSSWRRCP